MTGYQRSKRRTTWIISAIGALLFYTIVLSLPAIGELITQPTSQPSAGAR